LGPKSGLDAVEKRKILAHVVHSPKRLHNVVLSELGLQVNWGNENFCVETSWKKSQLEDLEGARRKVIVRR